LSIDWDGTVTACCGYYDNKLITTDSGGMLVTNDERLGDRAKHLSTQAKESVENNVFQHNEIGYSFRLPNILAAMGCAQLENIGEHIDIKKVSVKSSPHFNP
jgi:perosamine synthetase